MILSSFVLCSMPDAADEILFNWALDFLFDCYFGVLQKKGKIEGIKMGSTG